MIKIQIGDRFGNWTIIDNAADRIDSSGKHHKRFKCRCDCGTIIDKDMYKLKNGAKMCKSCYLKIAHKNSIPFEHYHNQYAIKDNVAIFLTHNTSSEFYVDLDDVDKIKDICWYENEKGYIYGYNTTTKKRVALHQYIMGVNEGTIIDHINRNPKDCRRNNMRKCTQRDNVKNKGLYSNNMSGYNGVHFDKKSNKWISYINCNNKRIYLGRFNNKTDAINSRLLAEKQYFGEFAPIH